MPKYYIQAQAFNLDNIISDTYDISTIRGGSFMLLDAVKSLPMAIPALKSIATAASKGIFSYESFDLAHDNMDLNSSVNIFNQSILYSS